MEIRIRGAREHNLKNLDVDLNGQFTAVTGVSGSGKSSLIYDTLYYEAKRRFQEAYGSGSMAARLSPAAVDRITGLGPAVSIGQNLLNRNPASTLASSSGLHPLLRLLYANFGDRKCPTCGKSYIVLSRDEIAQQITNLQWSSQPQVAIPLFPGGKSKNPALLRMLPDILPVGWTIREDDPGGISILISLNNLAASTIQDILDDIEAIGGYAVDVEIHGSLTRLSWAPQCISCGRWFEQIKPRDFHRTCGFCHGTGCVSCNYSGLPAAAAAVTWQGLPFKQLMALSVKECLMLIEKNKVRSERLHEEIKKRLMALFQVGLGYVSLDRPSPTLSRGEAQRVRLATTLVNRLEDLLRILDEPTVGLHASDVKNLMHVLRNIHGPVIVIEHDRGAVAEADEVIDIGPAAGEAGGQLVFQGTPSELWQANTATGLWFSRRKTQETRQDAFTAKQFLEIRGARANNLNGINVKIPIGCMTVVTGVSGSGKSSLVKDVLAATLRARQPVECSAFEGNWLESEIVDQSPIGKNPRSNPATYTQLADVIRDIFAKATGISPSHFSFNRPEGACPECAGYGAVEVKMRYLPSTWVTCERCEGKRFNEYVLQQKVTLEGEGYTISDIFGLPIASVMGWIAHAGGLEEKNKAAALRILNALCALGLGYLSLGQPSTTLSGGEAQRVKLARFLGQQSLTSKLLILDEPSTGLHAQDLAGLLDIFARLTANGATLVVVEHNLDVIQAANWVIDLGPGAGENGGGLVFMGPVKDLAGKAESLTAAAITEDQFLQPRSTVTRSSQKAFGQYLQIKGARANNLRNINVDIPKGKLTVVTGLSGSGKSSLVRDVLEREAEKRFYETLSMYERQGIHENKGVEVDEMIGLGVTLRATPERLAYSRRSTVGTLTEISYHLAALLSGRGTRECLQCGSEMAREQSRWLCRACGATSSLASPSHFLGNSYASACQTCHGVGSQQVPNPGKLIIAPDKPLCAGAMYSPGFFPNGYLGKPGNYGYFLVQALGRRYGFDPHRTPWNQISPEAQKIFLFGSNEEFEISGVSTGGRTVNQRSRFPGFYGFIGDWDVGNTYTDNVSCPSCGGSRLRPEYLAVKLGGSNIETINNKHLHDLLSLLGELSSELDILPLAVNYRAVMRRLDFLCRVGLNYLTLSRPAGTLSAGEVQRLRLAGLLGSELTSITVLLDEPTRGLHPAEVGALLTVLKELCESGNTVIVVEHDESIIRAADYLIDMGPGPGEQGGLVTACGSLESILQRNTITTEWLKGRRKPNIPAARRRATSWMELRGARANNLRGMPVRFPYQVLTGVCGVSGSGKSTLVIDTLGRILAPVKHTTSVANEPLDPGAYDELINQPPRALVVDQSKAGMSSPGNWLGVNHVLKNMFLEIHEERGKGSRGIEAPICSECGGRGYTTLDMEFLPDFHEACAACDGSGWADEAASIMYRGVVLKDLFDLTLSQVLSTFGDEEKVGRPLRAAIDVGLGYLVLRQPGHTLSGGEAQRLKIAQELAKGKNAGTFYIFDEPTVGLHLEDVFRLCGVLHRLVDSGSSVLVVEHHPHVLASCDWLIELGPGGGADGGDVIANCSPEELARGYTPMAPFLKAVLEGSR